MLVYARFLCVSDEYDFQKRNLVGMKTLEIEVALRVLRTRSLIVKVAGEAAARDG